MNKNTTTVEIILTIINVLASLGVVAVGVFLYFKV